MKKGMNHTTGEKTFYYVERKTDKKHFFVLPSIIVKEKTIYNHELEVKSVLIGFLSFVWQINFCEVIKDVSLDIKQSDLVKIAQLLNAAGLKVESKNEFINFLNKNPNLLILLKNANPKHQYVITTVNLIFAGSNLVSSI